MSVPPSGITPAASFELAGFEPQLPPPTILADKLDPATGDFASLTETRTVADGLVTYLLGVRRGSGAAQRSFGHRFREIRHADEQAPELLESFCREALQPGIDSETIRFRRVEAEIDAGDGTQVNATIDYVDLLASRQDRDKSHTFTP